MTIIADLLGARSADKGQRRAAEVAQKTSDASIAEQRRQYDLSRADMQPWLSTGTGALGQLARLYGINSGAQPAMAQPASQMMAPQGYGGNVTPGGTMVPAYDGRQGGTYAQMMQLVDSGQLQGDGPVGGMGTAQYGQTQQIPTTQTAQAPAQSGGQFDTFWQSPDYNFRQNEQMRALTARNAALGIQDSGAAQRSALQLSGNLASAEYNNYANRLAALAGVGQTAAQSNASLGQNFAGAVTGINQNLSNALGSSYINRGNIYGNLWSNLGGQAGQAAAMFLGGR